MTHAFSWHIVLEKWVLARPYVDIFYPIFYFCLILGCLECKRNISIVVLPHLILPKCIFNEADSQITPIEYFALWSSWHSSGRTIRSTLLYFHRSSPGYATYVRKWRGKHISRWFLITFTSWRSPSSGLPSGGSAILSADVRRRG